MNTISPVWIKETMNKYHLYFDKRFGQNFLIDENARKKIISCLNLSCKDTVIEIGSGLGAITSELSRLGGRVYAVEIDKRLASILESIMNFENLEIINDDILNLDLSNFKDGTKVVGNLPYYITSAIIMKFLESETAFSDMVFMMQKEVGERIISKEGSKDYSVLSAITQIYSDVEKVHTLSASCFMPKPKVESVVMKFNRKNVDIPKSTIPLIKAAFSSRRKTIYNSLSNKYSKDTVSEILRMTDISSKRRAETVSPAEYLSLAENYELFISRSSK